MGGLHATKVRGDEGRRAASIADLASLTHSFTPAFLFPARSPHRRASTDSKYLLIVLACGELAGSLGRQTRRFGQLAESCSSANRITSETVVSGE